MCFSFFFRELIGQKRKQCGRGQEIEGLPPPPSFSRLTPVQLSSGIPYFTNQLESQTNNTQSPPLPVKQSKNINSDSRI